MGWQDRPCAAWPACSSVGAATAAVVVVVVVVAVVVRCGGGGSWDAGGHAFLTIA